MTYEGIWKKIKRMKQWERSMLGYEMTLKGFKVDYIHPHYYFDAKAVHDIVFYAPHKQWETDDEDGTYYKALKEIVENDKVIHIRVKRYVCFSKFINNWREGKIVKNYFCSRINEEYVNAWYKIYPVKVWRVNVLAHYSLHCQTEVK